MNVFCRFTFECRLECDTLVPVIQWLKDNEPIKGFVPSYKDGICRLTIEETMLRDSGSFVCQAKTEAGSTETSATLRVKGLTLLFLLCCIHIHIYIYMYFHSFIHSFQAFI